MAVLSMTLVQAQERTYSGVVKGSDGQPIIGASVEVVGTTVGTSTGLDGDYTIKALSLIHILDALSKPKVSNWKSY